MTDARNISRHDEVVLLLPWFVNGTLDADERELVEAHLQRCERCRAEVDQHRRICAAVRNDDATPIVPQPDALALLDGAAAKRRYPGHAARRRNYLPLAASVAAIGLLVAWASWRSLQPRPAPLYETVTSAGGEQTSLDLVVEISFREDVARDTQHAILVSVGAADISALAGEGSWKAVFPRQPASLEQVEHLSARLRSVDGIAEVDVVAAQIPVEPR